MTDSHARSLKSVVQDMLPSRCATGCMLVGNDETSPYLEERNQVQGYAANRMNECFAGRRAARRVVNAMGASPLLYPQGFGGEPIWPQGFIGSITHTGRVALAVAARSSTAHSIGVDFEVEQTTPYRPMGYYPAPLRNRSVRLAPPTRRSALSRILFSTKEDLSQNAIQNHMRLC